MSHSFASCATVAPGVIFRVVGHETILVNLETELYLGLDSVGTDMWLAVTNTSSIQDAYDTLLQQYDVDPEQLRHDLDDFIHKLIDQSLIQLSTERARAEVHQ